MSTMDVRPDAHADAGALNKTEILSCLAHDVFDITVLPETGSTNDDARASAANGAREFTVIASELQRSGRGRMGRSFYSPQRTGLYFSIVLRPKLNAADALFITTSAAVAAAQAIEDICSVEAGIKWVNDVFVGGKKVCGILTESSIDAASGRLDHAVLGIGINILPPEGGFPPELQGIAGCLCPNGDCPPNVRNRLLARVLDLFYEFYRRLPTPAFLPEYRRRSVLIGREVNVFQGNDRFPARVTGIDDRCRLLVEHDGAILALDSGEVSVRLQ